MSADHVYDRSVLRFAKEVGCNFSFLEMLGFHCVQSEATYVRYESSRININIYHGRRSFEIGLEVESASSPTDAYSYAELLCLIEPRLAGEYRNYATHTVQGVMEGVRRLAEQFHRCTASGILNDEQLFSRLKHQRAHLREDYALITQLLQARKRSEAAWRERDYATVVKALKPLRANLTKTEIRKLEFAEKHLE